MRIARLKVSLEGFEVGISGAVPDPRDWPEPAMDRAILEFVAQLSGLVMKYGGRIVHGSHPTFTPVILHQARLHGAVASRRPVTLVMSELWARGMTAADRRLLESRAELVVTRQDGPGGPEVAETRNKSLARMRTVLVQMMNVMVAVGGKAHLSDGILPGVREELDLARSRGIASFLVGGLGGMAAQYAKELADPASLGNELSPARNRTLLETRDVGSCVSIVFDHLAKNAHLARLAKLPVRWNPYTKAVVDHRDGSVDSNSTSAVLEASGKELVYA